MKSEKQKSLKEKEEQKNEIICILYIETNNYNEDILLFNNNEKNKNDFIHNIKVYIKGNKINVKNIEEDQWIFNYDFKEKGEYEIKIEIDKRLTNLSNLFVGCKLLYSVDLSNLDTSNVTEMEYMFACCEQLKRIKGIEKLKTNKVINMKGIFEECCELEELDLSNFDTSKVTDMKLMFSNCAKLKRIKGLENFNTSQVVDMQAMFQQCIGLEELDLSHFDTSNVTDISFMFVNCFNLKRIKGIEKFNTTKVKSMKTLFQQCKELEELDLSNFDTSNVTDMGFMFNNCLKLKRIKGLEKFNTSKVADMKAIFGQCNEIETLDLSNFDTSKITDMGWFFCYCYKLRSIKGLEKFNTKQVINMRAMFQACTLLEELDLSNFDTSKVTDMQFMFASCEKLKRIKGIEKFNTSHAIGMKTMFQDCRELEELDLLNFDTSNVNDMGYMFANCFKLKRIKGIEKFKTNQVVTMRAMFQQCKELEELDLSKFDTSNVDDMGCMFAVCSKLKSLNLLSFSVNSDCDLENMFYQINPKCELSCNDDEIKSEFYSYILDYLNLQ